MYFQSKEDDFQTSTQNCRNCVVLKYNECMKLTWGGLIRIYRDGQIYNGKKCVSALLHGANRIPCKRT